MQGRKIAGSWATLQFDFLTGPLESSKGVGVLTKQVVVGVEVEVEVEVQGLGNESQL